MSAPALFDQIVARLEKVSRPNGDGQIMALCPFHNDTNPSLSVHPSKGWYCHAEQRGGGLPELAQKLGIEFSPNGRRDDVPAHWDAARAQEAMAARKLRPETLAHFHVTLDLEQQAWRYPVSGGTRWKSFTGKPKKYWHSKGTPNQLYGLGDVPDSTEAIWLVNGEPSVWACWQAGIPAVCNIFGEGQLPENAASQLKARGISTIHVVFDLDPRGRDGARKVAAVLRGAGLTVRVRQLPDYLGEHGDVGSLFVWYNANPGTFVEALESLNDVSAVYLAAGHSVAELEALIDAPILSRNGDGDAGDNRIPSGARNTELTSLAGSMRRRGMTPDAIEAALLVENVARCDPPLPDDEVKRIVRSVARYEPTAPAVVTDPLSEVCPLTDLGNARRLALRFGDRLKYAQAWGWLSFSGTRWTRDDTGEVERCARATVRAIFAEAQLAVDNDSAAKIGKWAAASQNRNRLEAMIALAQSEPEIVARPSDFDRDSWLLNVTNGTLDLRTGELRPHDPGDFITRIAGCDFDADAQCPTWLSFLDRIMDGNAALIDFLRRAAGYSLTGDTSEQCLFLCYGTGANGKSTFLETLRAMLGDFGQSAEFVSFLDKRSDNARNDIARMAGARFVAAIEAGEGRRLAEVLIKSLTGGDTVTARFLFREYFEFRPAFKVWLAANHKPTIRGTDLAIWRRIRLTPFTVTIPESERDPHMAERLRAELPGILAWAVQGCLEWQRNGLQTPDAVRAATDAYRTDMDMLAAFLSECCVVAPNAETKASELYGAYKSWAETNSEYVENQRAFGLRLSERGFEKQRTRDGIAWRGIDLLASV